MGDFLQSEKWREFQKSVGRETFFLEKDEISASIIEHKLPIIGNYFYIPRFSSKKHNPEFKIFLEELIMLAKKEKASWIRMDIDSEKELKLLKDSINLKINKAPHDVQPREVFIIDISKSEEDILSDMKPKTRYNIRLAEKKGIEISSYSHSDPGAQKFLGEFLKLNRIMSERSGISTHSDRYYKKMFESIPGDFLRLYVAKYKDRVLAVDVVVFWENTAIYLHGASSNEHRNLMAPFLLKWHEILDAKKRNIKHFDLGGIRYQTLEKEKDCCKSDFQKIMKKKKNDWSGITRFKLGFSKSASPVIFLGSYDLIVNPVKYWLYRFMQGIKKNF